MGMPVDFWSETRRVRLSICGLSHYTRPAHIWDAYYYFIHSFAPTLLRVGALFFAGLERLVKLSSYVSS